MALYVSCILKLKNDALWDSNLNAEGLGRRPYKMAILIFECNIHSVCKSSINYNYRLVIMCACYLQYTVLLHNNILSAYVNVFQFDVALLDL
jgi:hypothetical protein